MNSLDAAEAVLLQTGHPLTPYEIARLMIEKQLWQTAGKTPGATVDARISVDIKEKRAGSRFQRTARGVFALRAWGLPEFQRVPKAVATEIPSQDTEIIVEQELPPQEDISSNEPQLPTSQAISFADAAEKVLEQFGNNAPMNYRDITRRALRLGLVSTQGQTPEQTMYAQILADNEKYQKRGEVPRFVKDGRGTFSLSKWVDPGLAAQIEQHNNEVRSALHKWVYSMLPKDFENLIGTLLVKIGFEQVEVTGRSGDGGIDVRGTLVVGGVIRTRMAVQAKRWKNNVQAPTVQQVRGSLGAHEQGLIIATSSFSSGARSEAERSDATPVALMDGTQLVNLLIENNIGIQRKSYDLIELGENTAD